MILHPGMLCEQAGDQIWQNGCDYVLCRFGRVQNLFPVIPTKL